MNSFGQPLNCHFYIVHIYNCNIAEIRLSFFLKNKSPVIPRHTRAKYPLGCIQCLLVILVPGFRRDDAWIYPEGYFAGLRRYDELLSKSCASLVIPLHASLFTSEASRLLLLQLRNYFFKFDHPQLPVHEGPVGFFKQVDGFLKLRRPFFYSLFQSLIR